MMGVNLTSISEKVKKIYDSREKMVNGEPDWYAVLGLEKEKEKTITIEKISAKYYNLYHEIEASKNKVVGVEGALQILTEANCMLTNTFWTNCSNCEYLYQYSNVRIGTKLVCLNCGGSFVGVPLHCGNYPMNQRNMSSFWEGEEEKEDVDREERSSILALEDMQKAEEY